MKSLIYGDVHFSQFASILRKQGTKYSQRLEGIIDSLNWAEKLAVQNNCDNIIGLGDFFDKSYLNAEELSALQEVKWANIPHYFLVGNHEMGQSSLEISSAHLLNLIPQFTLIEKPLLMSDLEYGVEYEFIPYILESNRQPLSKYFLPPMSETKRIIFSHNDLAGIQMGAIVSKEGFDLEDIKANSVLCINGHIHSGSWVDGNRILNLGNLTGQNFGEDATQFSHNVLLLSATATNIRCEFFENPYAFNFYKLGTIHKVSQLPIFKPNAVVSCGAYDENLGIIRDTLKANPNVIESRIILTKEYVHTDETQIIDAFKPIDHLAQFKKYVLENIGSDTTTMTELEEILK